MNHANIYVNNYFYRTHDSKSLEENRLRFGDQFSAICYTFGIHFLDVFHQFKNITVRDFCWDLPYPQNAAFFEFELINSLYKDNRYLRKPKSILEIGGGRGEVMAFLNYTKIKLPIFDYELQALDPAIEFQTMYDNTCNRLFECSLTLETIIGTLKDKYREIKYNEIDTVIMCEVIEHLTDEEFWKFLNYALPCFRKNNTRLIIVNSWGYWPIEQNGCDHIWEINDEVYDKIQKLAKATIIRSRSHLVVEF